jgi:hypothetical protein
MWTKKSGYLPNGLTLMNNGIIVGVPTRSGKFTFTVNATNSAGAAEKELSIQIGGSGIDNPTISELIAWTENGVLYISGLKAGEKWGVYNVAGVLVAESAKGKKREGSNIESVKLPSSGVYIIRSSEGRATKIINN